MSSQQHGLQRRTTNIKQRNTAEQLVYLKLQQSLSLLDQHKT